MNQLTVEWLPIGHITHGYRRVFIIHDEIKTRNVVVLAPLPYEVVFQVAQTAGSTKVKDPSLWWGLSTVVQLLGDGTLDTQTNPDLADDGYLLYRPSFAGIESLIALDVFHQALQSGRLTVVRESDAIVELK